MEGKSVETILSASENCPSQDFVDDQKHIDECASSPMPGESSSTSGIDKETELRIWCAVRTDLDMPVGKVANQAGHAFVAALWAAPHDIAVAYMGDDGQGKIVVRVKNESELVKMYQICKDAGLTSIIVKDQGRTVFGEPTFTTMAVGPCRASDLPKPFRRLRLL